MVNYLLVGTMSTSARVELVMELIKSGLGQHFLDQVATIVRDKLDQAGKIIK